MHDFYSDLSELCTVSLACYSLFDWFGLVVTVMRGVWVMCALGVMGVGYIKAESQKRGQFGLHNLQISAHYS